MTDSARTMYAPSTSATYPSCAQRRPIRDEIVEMPARLSSRMSRHSLPCRIAATSRPTGIDRTSAVSRPLAAHREVRTRDHQRAHQQEDEGNARAPGSCTRSGGAV